MKNILKGFLLLFIIGGFTMTSADWWGNATPEVYICKGEECSIEQGVTATENSLRNVETKKTLSEYIVDTVLTVLTFLALIGIIVIMYSGFSILTSAGEEEKLKSGKKTIIYVLIGFVIIFLAGPIYFWLEEVLNKSGSTT